MAPSAEDDEKQASGLMTYPEYRAHCHAVHREALPRRATGPVITAPQYALPRTLPPLRPVFAALASGGTHITRGTLDRALPLLRLSLRHVNELFEIVGTDSIDFECFRRVFGGDAAQIHKRQVSF